MLSEAAELLPNFEEPQPDILFQRPAEADLRHGAPVADRGTGGLEFAAFLFVLMLFVWICWPSEDDQMMLQSTLLYAVILNSN